MDKVEFSGCKLCARAVKYRLSLEALRAGAQRSRIQHMFETAGVADGSPYISNSLSKIPFLGITGIRMRVLMDKGAL
ncbi:MAG: hypothetical protein HXY40_05390 [Chloroflexi bacterium]|nr:hypothetical protein [Chloroflexota bacterium]